MTGWPGYPHMRAFRGPGGGGITGAYRAFPARFSHAKHADNSFVISGRERNRRQENVQFGVKK